MSSITAPGSRLRLPLRTAGLLLALAGTLSGAGAQAQDVTGEALNGTVTLSSGFLPDPHVVDIVPGGDTLVPDHGAACTGYIFAAQPNFKLVYQSVTGQLGIFVSSNIDTTLVINDPSGVWHCNDDSDYLGNSNPGILFAEPQLGTYDIWVGTSAELGTESSGKLVITERGAADWSGLNLGAAPTAGSSTPPTRSWAATVRWIATSSRAQQAIRQ